MCVKLLRSQLEAIQKLESPKTVKGCRSFAGMVNFLSIFCQDLQKLLKPIYDLTRKGRPFIWQQEQQTTFEEIKSRLQKPPILHLPDGKGRFHLYSDTSKYATGSALYQIQNGKPKLIAYASKRLPEAARNYSITELEMCGLATNITSFAHLLKKVDFDAKVDHLALVHILKSKTEPATPRIKRLLEVLNAYSFNLYYMKGKDMILSNFLSRQEIDKSDLHEIIPISFDMKAILNDKCYKIEEENSKYLVQMRSQAKERGISMYLKVMPKSYRGHKFILCVIDEITNYLITMPVYEARSEEIGDSLIDNVISNFGIPEYLIMDQDSSFMSAIMNYLFRKLNIKIKTVAPFNHKSLQAEHGIKSLSTILTKHLTEQGQMWPKYLPLATLAHNTFNSPNLANYSPYKLTFGRKPKILIDIETDPDIKVSGNFTEYYKLLEK